MLVNENNYDKMNIVIEKIEKGSLYEKKRIINTFNC